MHQMHDLGSPAQPPRWQRGVLKVTRHVLHLAINLVGDDPLSKQLRHRLLVLFGATIGTDCHLHGGTFYANPHHLHLADRVFINRDCYLDLDAPIVIGNDVVIGHRVTITTANHHIGPHHRRAGPLHPQPVHIGDGVWIGANATILPGVTIGPGAIIAAGAVVTTNIPTDTLVAGVPARPLRSLT